jgi:hypothetical protein
MIRILHNGELIATWATPEITRGWWTDANDEPVSQALLTDVVRFHVETYEIDDGKEIKVTFYDNDGPLNIDDRVVEMRLTVNNNRGFAEIEIARSWRELITSDGGRAIELYAECEYISPSFTLPFEKEHLKVFNVGYLAHNDSRVKVDSSGALKFWAENMTAIAYNAWRAKSSDPNNWPDGEVGVSRDIGYISFDSSGVDAVSINNESHNPNANEAVLRTERGPKKDGTPDMRQTPRYITTASPTARINGAVVILVINIIIGVWEYGMKYLQIYENRTLKKHLVLFCEVFNKVASWYNSNTVPPQYNNFASFYEVVNVVLFGSLEYSTDENLFLFAKDIYKGNTTNYEKE